LFKIKACDKNNRPSTIFRTYGAGRHIVDISGLFFEHNPREIGCAFHGAGAEIGPRLNIKYGFNWASKKTIYGWTLAQLTFRDHLYQGDRELMNTAVNYF
jgi:hypothetical protein